MYEFMDTSLSLKPEKDTVACIDLLIALLSAYNSLLPEEMRLVHEQNARSCWSWSRTQ